MMHCKTKNSARKCGKLLLKKHFNEKEAEVK